ncbi:hypothetical protein ACEQ8H_002040 [Pleosporales sp. CAS-2024a]
MASTAPLSRKDSYSTTLQLPSWLAKHVKLDFDDDDVTALIDSIESSQTPPSSGTLLPAELVLQIIEHVPIDHLVDWRLVCRGFRDAIDGRTLYHHLQRTQLVGFVGSHTHWPLRSLSEEQYDGMQFLNARFSHVEDDAEDEAYAIASERQRRPLWLRKYAVFQIDMSEFLVKYDGDGGQTRYDSSIEYADTIWDKTVERLELVGAGEGFGTLRWCIQLDRAVLDLDLPLEAGRQSFRVSVDIGRATIEVAWREMLFRFLKSEAALRRMLEQRKASQFTFSLAEDCLREVRRRRLLASLDPDSKVDRHLMWSLRLLRPLFGRPMRDHAPLQAAEDIAINALLFLRRKASLSNGDVARLHQLREDMKRMQVEWKELEQEFDEYRAHMFPGFGYSIPVAALPEEKKVPHNPIAWSDELHANIYDRVTKWRAQKKVMKQIHGLLSCSNQALSIPNDSFDDLSSDL